MRRIRLVFVATVVLGCSAAVAASPAGPRLADYVAPAGASWCVLPGGGVAVLEGRAGPMRTWDAAGRPAGTITVVDAPVGGSPMPPAASRTHIALLWRGADDGVVVQLYSLARGRRIRQLTFPSFPATVTLGPDAVVMERLSLDDPAPLQVFDLKGKAVATYPLPADLVRSVRLETGSPWLAHVRTFFAGDELWGVPGGLYELWRLGKAPSRIEVEPGRRVVGNRLTGETAARWYEERGVPPGPRRAAAVWQPAVRQASPSGHTVALLLEDRPDAESGRCRVDLWSFPGPRPGESVRIPGPCPDAVYQGVGGLWLRRQGRVEWFPWATACR